MKSSNETVFFCVYCITKPMGYFQDGPWAASLIGWKNKMAPELGAEQGILRQNPSVPSTQPLRHYFSLLCRIPF